MFYFFDDGNGNNALTPPIDSVENNDLIENWIKKQDFIVLADVQRKFRIGYGRSSEIVKHLIDEGVLEEKQKDYVYKVIRKPIIPLKLGVDFQDREVLLDLTLLPHLFIGGSTGSGKSVLIHSLISRIRKVSHGNVKFVLFDPKRVEFSRYSKEEKLLFLPVVNGYVDAYQTLESIVNEIDRRNELLNNLDIEKYNKSEPIQIPYLVCVFDEFYDICNYGTDVDVNRIKSIIIKILKEGQKVGIHLIIATQLIMGLDDEIMSFIPSRLCIGSDVNKKVYKKLFNYHYKGEVVKQDHSGLLLVDNFQEQLLYLVLNGSSLYESKEMVEEKVELWNLDKIPFYAFYSHFLCINCGEEYYFPNKACKKCGNQLSISTKVGIALYNKFATYLISNKTLENIRNQDLKSFLTNNSSFTELEQKMVDKLLKNERLANTLFDYYKNEFYISQEASKQKQLLECVRINKLFGTKTLEYRFNLDEKLSIIYGPNGMGKTTIFRLIDACLCNDELKREQRFSYLLDAPFEMLVLQFSDGTTIKIEKDTSTKITISKKGDSNHKQESVNQLVKNFNDNVKADSKLFYENVSCFLPQFYLNKNSLLFIKVNRVNSGIELVNEITELSKHVNLNLEIARNPHYFENIYESRISNPEFVEDLKRTIVELSFEIATQYKELIGYINYYVVKTNNLIIDASLYSLFKKIKKTSFCLDSLRKLKFKPENDEVSKYISGDDYYNDHLNEFEDNLKNYAVLYNKCQLFFDELSGFLNIFGKKDKTIIVLDGELKFLNDSNTIIDFKELSSGELNIASILYNLVFKTENGSLILIDEPEVSLHLSWQELFSDEILKLIENKDNIQVIVASHSPFICSGHDNLLIEPNIDCNE